MRISSVVVFASTIGLLAAAMPATGWAQARGVLPPARRQAVRQAIKAQRQAQRGDASQPVPNERAMLLRQVRQAWARQVQRQLNLNDQQMRSLNQVNTKYERQRGEILRDERQARLGLKAAMEDTTAADQNARVDQQLTLLVQAQKRRSDLIENEQKDLSGFLTPLQRARFFSMQERLAKRLQQITQSTAPVGPPPPENPLPQH